MKDVSSVPKTKEVKIEDRLLEIAKECYLAAFTGYYAGAATASYNLTAAAKAVSEMRERLEALEQFKAEIEGKPDV